MNNYGSTVAAISTPRGKGGVAMVRITGSQAIEVAERVFFPSSGKKMSAYPANTAVHGGFFADGEQFDDGMCVVFRAPHSFTGENVAELYCHGGLLVTKKLLEAVIESGASYAGPGEFTRRAFINGKLTLTEAEAVGDLIDAKSEAHLGAGIKRLKGALSASVQQIYDRLKTLAASAYAYIDYPDEDLTDVTVDEMKDELEACRDSLIKLWKTSKYGKAISEGVPAAIVGRPNTGKSSLLNLLCGTERAIVTDIEGTTRDVVTEQVVLGDVVLNLSDTAGIRDTADVVEKLGVERSFAEIDRAELILLVLDSETPDDARIAEYIANSGKADSTVVLYNKSDLRENVSRETMPCAEQTAAHPELDSSPLPDSDSDIGDKNVSRETFLKGFSNVIHFSAKTGAGLDELISAAARICGEAECEGAEVVITSARQSAMLKSAADAVSEARTSLDGFTQDIAGMQIEEALAILAELDGRQASMEIVDEIFSRFCVGK